MDTGCDTPTTIDQGEALVRVLGRLGIGALELITSIRDEIAVVDRKRRVVAILGDWRHESRPDGLLGKHLRETFGAQVAAVHEAAHLRALQGEHIVYEWTRQKGRHPELLSTTASPLRDSSSKILGVVLVTRRITSAGRDGKAVGTSLAPETKRLLELEEGIQQLAGTIENHRKAGHVSHELRANSPLHHLSSRERQVLDLLGQGYRPRSIAATLQVSPETVRNHLKAMFKKTGTHSQEELVALLRGSGER